MQAIQTVIAQNMKLEREAQNLSLDRLSEISGVSKSMLHQMEKGESNPSINTLYKISNALKITLSALIASPQDGTIVVDQAELTPVSNEEGSFRIVPLFPFAEGRRFEIFYGEIAPGTSMDSEAHPLGTQEFLTVFSGEMLLCIGEAEYRLSAGQAITFAADALHSYHNLGQERVIFSNTMFLKSPTT